MNAEALYDDKQANEILRTSVRLAARDEITLDEIVAAARELGIPREEVERAEATYQRNQTEQGQRAQFRRMQAHELGLSLFHVGVLTLIAALIAIFDFREYVWTLVPLILGIAAAYVIYRFTDIYFNKSDKHEKAFQEWIRRKQVWLRPERAREIVNQTIQKQLDSNWWINSLRDELIFALQKRLGYDKKRAEDVLNAYLRENPEVEVRLNA